MTYRWLWHKLSFQRGAFMSCCSPISQFFWGEPQAGESTLQSPVLHSFSYSTTSQFLFSSGDALALVKHLGQHGDISWGLSAQCNIFKILVLKHSCKKPKMKHQRYFWQKKLAQKTHDLRHFQICNKTA